MLICLYECDRMYILYVFKGACYWNESLYMATGGIWVLQVNNYGRYYCIIEY